MLVETLIQNTLEMQGFRVAEVTFVNGSLEAEIVPDRRCAPCCGVCGQRAAYRDTYTASTSVPARSVVGNRCLFAFRSPPGEL